MPSSALRRSAVTAALTLSFCVVVLVPPAHGEPPAPTAPSAAAAKVPPFDVISVKPNNTAAHMVQLQFTPDGIRATNITIEFLLRDSFGVNGDQLINAPGWVKSAAYDIEAKVASDDVAALKNLNRDQRASMMLNILTDRFKLAYHRETRVLPGYDLVVAKGGPKMEEFKATTDESGKPRGNRMMMSGSSMTAEGIKMDTFVRMLSNRIGRPIVDKTALTGSYNFKLDFAPETHDGAPEGPMHDPGPGASAASGDTGPSIFTALQEQLGLKLESEKGPVPVIVIDQIEQPAAN